VFYVMSHEQGSSEGESCILPATINAYPNSFLRFNIVNYLRRLFKFITDKSGLECSSVRLGGLYTHTHTHTSSSSSPRRQQYHLHRRIIVLHVVHHIPQNTAPAEKSEGRQTGKPALGSVPICIKETEKEVKVKTDSIPELSQVGDLLTSIGSGASPTICTTTNIFTVQPYAEYLLTQCPSPLSLIRTASLRCEQAG